jgi:hypothetical protein
MQPNSLDKSQSNNSKKSTNSIKLSSQHPLNTKNTTTSTNTIDSNERNVRWLGIRRVRWNEFYQIVLRPLFLSACFLIVDYQENVVDFASCLTLIKALLIQCSFLQCPTMSRCLFSHLAFKFIQTLRPVRLLQSTSNPSHLYSNHSSQ